jgi:hypothetical protein
MMSFFASGETFDWDSGGLRMLPHTRRSRSHVVRHAGFVAPALSTVEVWLWRVLSIGESSGTEAST